MIKVNNQNIRLLIVLLLWMAPALLLAQTGIEYIARDIQVSPKQNIVIYVNDPSDWKYQTR